MDTVEFAVLGAGAMGSIIGAHLARSGHSVVMLARGQRARQIEQQGLHITGLSAFSQPVPVMSEASQLRRAKLLILATKTYGTEAALAPLRRADIGAAFSVQNGLMKNEQLANAFGRDRVLGALANLSGELLPSGEVLFTRNAMLTLGELDGADSARAQQIAATIDASGVRAVASGDILSLEWSKFASWAGMMVLSVTTRAVSWKYLSDSGSALVLVRLVQEIGLLAAACGIALSDRSTLPVATICRVSEQQALEVVQNAGLEMKSRALKHRMSTLQDLEAGRPLEIEETLGYALREAARLQLRLPLLDSCYHLVSALDRIRGESRSPS